MNTLIGLLIVLFIAALPIILIFAFVEFQAKKQAKAEKRGQIDDANQSNHLMQDKPFLPSISDSRKACIAIGVGALASSVVELFNPTLLPPTGRWSWFTSFIFNNFGSLGLSALWAAIGLFIIFGLIRSNPPSSGTR